MKSFVVQSKIALGLVLLGSALFSLSSCQSAKKTPPAAVISGNSTAPAGYHRVGRGENLYRISLKYGTTVATLTRLNNLSDAGQIEVGQLIKLPSRTGYAGGAARPGGSAPKPVANNAAVARMNFGWPLKGSVVGNFNGSTNKGIDIRGSLGSPVHAAAGGKVIYNDYVEGYGRLILLSHDASNSILTAYGNNRETLVKLNQVVKKGQVIARMGVDDNNQPVLHFEIRSNGVAVNPIAYLQ